MMNASWRKMIIVFSVIVMIGALGLVLYYGNYNKASEVVNEDAQNIPEPSIIVMDDEAISSASPSATIAATGSAVRKVLGVNTNKIATAKPTPSPIIITKNGVDRYVYITPNPTTLAVFVSASPTTSSTPVATIKAQTASPVAAISTPSPTPVASIFASNNPFPSNSPFPSGSMGF